MIDYFSGGTEQPSFGEWCGECDVCKARSAYGSDNERNFYPEAVAALKVGVFNVFVCTP